MILLWSLLFYIPVFCATDLWEPLPGDTVFGLAAAYGHRIDAQFETLNGRPPNDITAYDTYTVPHATTLSPPYSIVSGTLMREEKTPYPEATTRLSSETKLLPTPTTSGMGKVKCHASEAEDSGSGVSLHDKDYICGKIHDRKPDFDAGAYKDEFDVASPIKYGVVFSVRKEVSKLRARASLSFTDLESRCKSAFKVLHEQCDITGGTYTDDEDEPPLVWDLKREILFPRPTEAPT